MCIFVLQRYFTNDRLDFNEKDPSVPVVIYPTVPISCPPCSMTLSVVNPLGYTVSTCRVTFYTYDSTMTSRTISIRAVPTTGSNARTARMEFNPVTTKAPGSGWDGYTVPAILVRL